VAGSDKSDRDGGPALSWRVTLRAAADADLTEIHSWYESQRPGLGNEFLLSVADAMQRLEDSADRYPLYFLEFRRVLTKRFPYKIFYRLEGDAAIVFRVLHSGRDYSKALQ
jgi:toxin ParE1/3/4